MERTGYFESQPGRKSSTRLMTFLALVAALIIAICSVFMTTISLGDSLPLVVTLLAYSLGAKSFQQIAEVKREKIEDGQAN